MTPLPQPQEPLTASDAGLASDYAAARDDVEAARAEVAREADTSSVEPL